MKLKKIFAGMAASAIAMTTFAMTATTASALDNAGNAGIAFQMAETYNFRNVYGDGDTAATFPGVAVGVQGAAYGLDTNVACGDTTIQYDGTYTVSIATSGTINQAPDNTKDWFINEEKGITREGSPWSMLGNYNPKATDDSAELTQDQIEWEMNGLSSQFNHLLVTTDIPCEYNDDNQPVVNGEVVKVTDITVDMCGTTYTGDVGVYKTDTDTLTIALINNYADDAAAGVGSVIDPTAMPAADGTITATFTISGLGADPNAATESSSTASTASTASTTSTSNNTNKSGGTSTTTSKTTTTSTTTSVASDKTENAPAGAPAGIALALAAVAGAAIVVSRRK